MYVIGGHHVKCSKLGSEKQRPHASHTWKIDPKDKTYTQEQARSYTNSDVEHVVTVELILYGTQGEKERKRE
jgi:hypothetical protein